MSDGIVIKTAPPRGCPKCNPSPLEHCEDFDEETLSSQLGLPPGTAVRELMIACAQRLRRVRLQRNEAAQKRDDLAARNEKLTKELAGWKASAEGWRTERNNYSEELAKAVRELQQRSEGEEIAAVIGERDIARGERDLLRERLEAAKEEAKARTQEAEERWNRAVEAGQTLGEYWKDAASSARDEAWKALLRNAPPDPADDGIPF